MYQRYLAYTLAFLMLATCSMNLQGQQEILIDAEKIERFKQQVRKIVDPAIDEGKMPGCVIGVGNRNGLFYQEAFGNRSIDPIQPMTLDTVFDLASITKPVATATSIMQLIEQGQLRLNDKVATHFPDFAVNGKEPITIEHLLLHTSGLIPDNPLADYLEGPEVAWQKILGLSLSSPIGTAFKYSDVNFMILGKIVEKISGKTLDIYTRDHIFHPLAMAETLYNPPEFLINR